MASADAGPNTALVLGASGISGWAQARECLVYPSASTFAKVIAVARRPLGKEAFQIPEYDARLHVHSGVDLSADPGTVFHKLQKIPGMRDVTHVYYAAYASHGSDAQVVAAANVTMLRTTVEALKKTCPLLTSFLLQTCTKAYGLEYKGEPGVVFETPIKETASHLPDLHASNVFYYQQHNDLIRLSKGESWSFCETRPDLIVGHTPQSSNSMNVAQALGIWLSMHVSLEGKGTEVPFPGCETLWDSLHRDTSQDTLARFNIYTSLTAKERVAGKIFNIADKLTTWSQVWPSLCALFGLRGTRPGQGPSQKLLGSKWVLSKKAEWSAWEAEHGLRAGIVESTDWLFLDAVLVLMAFDRQPAIDAARGIGFREENNTVEFYAKAFRRMRTAGVIPQTR